MRRRQYPVSVRREYFRLNIKWRIFHGCVSTTTIYPAKDESARHLLTKSTTTTNSFTDTAQCVVSTSSVVQYHAMYILSNKSNQVRVTKKLLVI